MEQVARIVSSLGGVYVLECDTGEWSVDIGFPDHKIAIEVTTDCLTRQSQCISPEGPSVLLYYLPFTCLGVLQSVMPLLIFVDFSVLSVMCPV